MNRRQEITLWVFGLLIAAASFLGGHNDGEWLFESGFPLAILGALLVFSLRTRERPAVKETKTVAAIVGALLFAAAGARVAAKAKAAEARADEAYDLAEQADATAEDAQSKAEEAATDADEAKSEAEEARELAEERWR